MLGRTDSRSRLLVLLVVFVIAATALVGRLAYWQVLQQDMLQTRAVAQTTLKVEESNRRGDIYDRSGTVVLATSVDRERLVASPVILTPVQRRQTGDELVSMLQLDAEDAMALRDKLSSDKPYVILARAITPVLAARIRSATAAKRVFSLALEPEPVRIYPQQGGGPDSSLAANLLGFVNRDGQGQYGIEQQYQETLAGTPRVILADRDAGGRPLLDTASVLDSGVPGQDIHTTIDAGLQLAVEQELLAAWVADKAKSVSAVVMDPYTGEVYAEATYPSYDANKYREVGTSAPGRFIDPVVSNVYEPGSVFKMMTAAAALGNKSVTLDTKFNDTGTLRLDHGQDKIDDANRKGMGWMTFADGVAWSRNVVAAKVALGLAKTTRQASAVLYDEWLKLGFGARTGIDVANEVSGIVRDPALTPWRQIDLANGSFGQGVAVTPIQLITAYAALMNGGTLVQPHVVKTIGSHDVETQTRGQVVDPTLSGRLVKLMNHVVTSVPTYRARTHVPGYEVGGKTGTAQIWDPKLHGGRGGWKRNLFNYSFVGYIAREKHTPDLVIAIRIEEGTPTIARVGQLEMPVMSFQLFRRIATNAITTPDLLRGRSTTTGLTPDR